MRVNTLASELFRCEGCGAEFEKAWTEEEARAEAAASFPSVPASKMAQVCDDCYQQLVRNGMPTRPEDILTNPAAFALLAGADDPPKCPMCDGVAEHAPNCPVGIVHDLIRRAIEAEIERLIGAALLPKRDPP